MYIKFKYFGYCPSFTMDLKKYNVTVAKQYVPEMNTELISQRYEPKLARLKIAGYNEERGHLSG